MRLLDGNRRSQWIGVAALLATGCLQPWHGSDNPDGGPPAVTGSSAANGLGNGNEQYYACAEATSAGHVPIHRLSNAEYDNTVRDLLLSQLSPGAAFPADARGASGYSNDSTALDTFDELVDDYYSAAVALAAELLASKTQANGAYQKLVPCAATMTAATQTACAQSSLARLATRAFRRPLTADEQARIMSVFSAAGNFDTGISDSVIALLLNPNFLFVTFVSDQSQNPAAQFALDDYQLASRLSYFLWQSMPDDELFAAAEAGTLHTDAVLATQIARMLADAKVAGALRALRDDFAGLSVLGASIDGLPDALRLSMIGETDRFLADLVAEDEGYMGLITSQTTFVNKQLADEYGVAFSGSDPSQFVKVTLPTAQRAGLLTQAGVLAATAGSTAVTHPVKRGLWVTTHILCSAPPPPPPDIPPLPETPPVGSTVRDLLNSHVADPVCAGCHATMDAIGLSLENYDPFGAWRDQYADGSPIDASGSLPSVPSFANAVDLYHALPQMAQVQACISGSLVGYALSRALDSSDDHCMATSIGARAAQPGAKFSDFVIGIVQSHQFREQQGEAP